MHQDKYYKIEHHKISSLLNDSTASKFVTRKWIEVHDLSNGQYATHKNIRFQTPILRSDLCHYWDAYFAVKGTIDYLAAPANKNDKEMEDVAFKSNVPFKSVYKKLTAQWQISQKILI